ncbi:MAG: RNA methyltransferase [Bacteroidota bacterium]|nr:RNA methyltransferase [Bacteroidota bacterium]
MRKLTTRELQRISVEEFKTSSKTPIVVVLDNIRSQNNIGAVFRTADAFRLESIHLCGITATPPNREIHKTALGATESVTWNYFKSTVESITFLKQHDYKIFAVEQTDFSTRLDLFIPPENKIALIFGNEVNGISEEVLPLVDGCLEIPQYGTKHSINISVAAGIVIWDLFVKIKKGKF